MASDLRKESRSGVDENRQWTVNLKAARERATARRPARHFRTVANISNAGKIARDQPPTLYDLAQTYSCSKQLNHVMNFVQKLRFLQQAGHICRRCVAVAWLAFQRQSMAPARASDARKALQGEQFRATAM